MIECAGWARTTRAQGNFFSFVELNDGSSHLSIQVVVDHTMPNFDEIAASKVGTSYKVKGKLIKSVGQNQKFELQVCSPENHEIKIIGKCDPGTYPLPTK